MTFKQSAIVFTSPVPFLFVWFGLFSFDERSSSRCSEMASGANPRGHKCGIRQDYHWECAARKVADKPLTLDSEGVKKERKKKKALKPLEVHGALRGSESFTDLRRARSKWGGLAASTLIDFRLCRTVRGEAARSLQREVQLRTNKWC